MPNELPKVEEIQTRDFFVSEKKDSINVQNRTVEVVCSTETEVERYFGIEILDHSEESVRLEKIQNNGPLLLGHNLETQIGTVDWIKFEGRSLVAQVRFSRSELATDIFNDVVDKIRKNISIGYVVHDYELVEGREDIFRARDWTPFEISIVPIQADSKSKTRSLKLEKIEVKEVEVAEVTKSTEEKPETRSPEEIEKDIQTRALLRVDGLAKLGAMYNETDLARSFIGEGGTVEALHAAILKKRNGESLIPLEVGLSQKEIRSFSFCDTILSLEGDSENSGLIREASNELEKRLGIEARGILIPGEIQHRDLSVGVAVDGGLLVKNELKTDSFIEMLKNKIALRRMGGVYLDGLVGDFSIPGQSGAAVAQWINENGSASPTSQTFFQIPFTPKTVSAQTIFSRKFLKQSSIQVESFVKADLASVIALAIDLAGINGSGVGAEPLGILNFTGVGAVIFVAAGKPTRNEILDMEAQLATGNALNGSLSYLCATDVRTHLKKTPEVEAQGLWMWQKSSKEGEGGEINSYRSEFSNQMPAGTVVFADFSQVVFGDWGVLDVTVDKSFHADKGATRVVVFKDVDFNIRHEESFVVGT